MSTISPLLADKARPWKRLPSGHLETDPLGILYFERLNVHVHVPHTDSYALEIQLEVL